MPETITGSRGEHVVPGAVWRHKRKSWRHVTIATVHDVELLDGESYVDVLRSTSRRRQPIKVRSLVRDYAFERMEVEADASKLAVYYSGSERDRFFLAPAGLGVSDAMTHRASHWYRTSYGVEQALERARRSS